MLINFSVENWRCFKNQAILNMTADRKRQHRERLPSVSHFSLRVLPISAIYGANASGKTKLIEALEFFRFLILNGTSVNNEKIPVQRYKLDPDCLSKPVKFSIDVLVDEDIYSYKAQALPEKIVEESLVIEKKDKAYPVFQRTTEKNIDFNRKFFTAERQALMEIITKQAVRENQLFLKTAIQFGVTELLPLYDWFENKLVIITPHSAYTALNKFADSNDELNSQMLDLVRKFGTGIDHFISRPIKDTTPQELPSIPRSISILIKDKNLTSVRFKDLYASNSGDEIIVKQLIAIHKNVKKEDIPFSLLEESDGTQRLLDLIPAFVDLYKKQNFVYVIDELDRSLHTQLLEWLIEYYLNSCGPESRNQLIFTTHDVNLLTQDLFRRDELWGVEKNRNGESVLYSFRDYKNIRHDKDIRKIYLNGLLGAVPNIN